MDNILRVLIVDDEKKICELITRLIDWEKMGLVVIGAVQDGQKAYETILQERPDIVISDIRMPSISGIEMIGRLREEGVSTRFIVISGYREFEYAQGALRYGVTDYLLKPINKVELTEALQKVRDGIQKKAEHQQDEQTKASEAAATSLTRYQMLNKLVSGARLSGDTTMAAFNQAGKYHFAAAPLQTLIVKADCGKPDALTMQGMIMERIGQITKRILAQRCSDFDTLAQQSRLYCLYQENASSGGNSLPQALSDALAALSAQYEEYALTVCTGTPAETPADLVASFAAARQAVAYRLLEGTNRVVEGAAVPTPPLSLRSALTGSNREALINAVELRDKGKIQVELAKIFAPFTKNKSKLPNLQLLYTLCGDVLEAVGQRYANEDGLPHMVDAGAVWQAVDNATTMEELVRSFAKAFLTWIEPFFAHMEKLASRPIRRALVYMEQHYADSLTLEGVAGEAHISPAYFSSTFKKETGTNFSEYLTALRLRQAKRMLRETDWSVAQIAEKVGYSDYRYFSKVFTKAFAISPNKYRKL